MAIASRTPYGDDETRITYLADQGGRCECDSEDEDNQYSFTNPQSSRELQHPCSICRGEELEITPAPLPWSLAESEQFSDQFPKFTAAAGLLKSDSDRGNPNSWRIVVDMNNNWFVEKNDSLQGEYDSDSEYWTASEDDCCL